MNYLSFYNQFANQGIVSTQDIQKVFPDFDARRLVEWQRKGYLRRIVNRWYLFTQSPVNEPLLWWVANRIYQPSYLSLETALSYHGLIPEGVYTCTSVSTRKTQTFLTSLGTFTYRNSKPSLFFGYDVLRRNDKPILMADLEKTILDYCYFNPQLKTEDDFASLRLNAVVLNESLNTERLHIYQQLMDNQQLNRRIEVLLKYAQSYA